MIKHVKALNPESEIRGLRRVINLLIQDKETLESELLSLKESKK